MRLLESGSKIESSPGHNEIDYLTSCSVSPRQFRLTHWDHKKLEPTQQKTAHGAAAPSELAWRFHLIESVYDDEP